MSRLSKTATPRGGSLAPFLERFATTLRADFRFAPFNALLLVAIFIGG